MPLTPDAALDGVLVDLRNATDATLRDSATITRNAATIATGVPCRIMFDRRPLHIEGLPSFLVIPRWKLIMPDGTSLKPGDVVPVAGKGSYTVVEITNPVTLSVSTTAFTVQTTDVDSALLLPFAKNADIRFKRPLTAETTALLPVFIRRANQMTDPRNEDGTPAYEWHMTYPLAAAYDSDATKPGVNHYILWSEFPGVEPTIAEQPDRVTNQFFGLASLCFNTTG